MMQILWIKSIAFAPGYKSLEIYAFFIIFVPTLAILEMIRENAPPNMQEPLNTIAYV